MRKVLSALVSFFGPNRKIFLVKTGSEEVDVGNLILHDQSVGLRDDSDEEVHENDEKNEDVESKENEPNQRNHLKLPEWILFSGFLVLDDLDPDVVGWGGEITDGVPADLKD